MKFAKVWRVLWWLAFGVSIALVVGSLPGYAAPSPVEEAAGVADAYSLIGKWLSVVFSVGGAVLCLALAALLYFRKRDEPMAFFISFYLLMYAVFHAGPLEMFLPFWLPASGDLALNLQGVVILLPSLALILIFPNGRFAPSWTRWLVIAAAALTLFGIPLLREPNELMRANTLRVQLYYAILGSLLFAGLSIQVYRYRKLYTPVERQQTKWVLYGLGLSYVTQGILAIPYFYLINFPRGQLPLWWASLVAPFWWLAICILPVTLTLAILRARLWDIDLIVRRTVQYGLVTLSLAFIYFGSVIVLQRVFAEITGAEHGEIVTVLSTLAIAVLFVPVRNRIQAAIDRRFNRQRYDAQKVLHEFGETVRDETDMERLTARLIQVVDETMQPKNLEVWLKSIHEVTGDSGRRSTLRGQARSSISNGKQTTSL